MDLPLSTEILATFDPLGSLSPPRLKDFADLCLVESISAGGDPFRGRSSTE